MIIAPDSRNMVGNRQPGTEDVWQDSQHDRGEDPDGRSGAENRVGA